MDNLAAAYFGSSGILAMALRGMLAMRASLEQQPPGPRNEIAAATEQIESIVISLIDKTLYVSNISNYLEQKRG